MKAPIGSFNGSDLTIENATEHSVFYASIVTYSFTEFKMSGYNAFNMNFPDDGHTKASICDARGENKNLPPMWLVCFYIADLDLSLKEPLEKGDQILIGPKPYGGGAHYAVIKAPAGACCTLFQEG